MSKDCYEQSQYHNRCNIDLSSNISTHSRKLTQSKSLGISSIDPRGSVEAHAVPISGASYSMLCPDDLVVLSGDIFETEPRPISPYAGCGRGAVKSERVSYEDSRGTEEYEPEKDRPDVAESPFPLTGCSG